MKLVIVGPGAMGCLLTGSLHKALSAEKIWLLDYKKERVEEIKKTGITIESGSGSYQIKPNITTDPNEIGRADLIIVCVKSYDTKKAIVNAKPLICDKSFVLTLQNGIGNAEIIGEVIGHDKVIAGVTNLGVTLTDIGKVKLAGKGETAIGRLDGKTTTMLRSIRELFNKAGLETKISRDIKALLWSKLIINVGINALTAITGLTNGKLMDFEGTRRIMREAVTEAIRIAKRKRIRLTSDDPLAKVEAVLEATSANTSSMLQDILHKKRTEIDFINGVIIRQGQELRIPVPINQVLVDLVKTIESLKTAKN